MELPAPDPALLFNPRALLCMWPSSQISRLHVWLVIRDGLILLLNTPREDTIHLIMQQGVPQINYSRKAVINPYYNIHKHALQVHELFSEKQEERVFPCLGLSVSCSRRGLPTVSLSQDEQEQLYPLQGVCCFSSGFRVPREKGLEAMAGGTPVQGGSRQGSLVHHAPRTHQALLGLCSKKSRERSL